MADDCPIGSRTAKSDDIALRSEVRGRVEEKYEEKVKDRWVKEGYS
jgi:hypothetical protein